MRIFRQASASFRMFRHSVPKRCYSKGNQGMNISLFRSVFEPLSPNHPAAGSIRDGRYLWRWDWHLRHLIYAMMPPAAAYLYLLAIKWNMGDKVEEYRHLVEQREAEDANAKVKTLGDRVLAMEIALELMESRREKEEREAVLEKVRAVLGKHIKA